MNIKKTLLFLLLCCLCGTTLWAQKYTPYSPIQFKNNPPLWQHQSKVTSFSDSIQAYLLEGEAMFDGNSVYLLHNIFNSYYQGYLFEKIEASTGNTQWQNYHFATALNERKYANTVTVHNDKVELTIFKENQTSPTLPYPVWVEANLNKTIYDKNTGSEIGNLKTNPLDSLNLRMTIPFVLVAGNTFSSMLLPKSNNTYWYLRQEAGYLVNRTLKFVLNNEGHVIDSSSYLSYNKYRARNHKNIQLKSGRFLSFIFTALAKNTLTDHEVKIAFFDKNVKIEKTVDYLSQLPQGSYYGLAYADEEYVIIKTNTPIQKDSVTTSSQISYSLFNHDGLHFETVTLDNYEQFRGAVVTLLPGTKTMLIANSVAEKEDNAIHILKSTGNNSLEKLKTIAIQKDGNILFLQTMVLTKNKDIYCSFAQTHEKNIDLPAAPQWAVSMLFSGKDIGLIVADNTVEQDDKIEIFPNPTYNEFNIQTPTSYDAVRITDIVGRTVQYSEAAERISISSLPKGIYFIELLKKNKVVSAKKSIVKIE